MRTISHAPKKEKGLLAVFMAEVLEEFEALQKAHRALKDSQGEYVGPDYDDDINWMPPQKPIHIPVTRLDERWKHEPSQRELAAQEAKQQVEQKHAKIIARKRAYQKMIDRDIKFYGPSDFFQLVRNSGIVLNVGGLNIPIEDLAKADWSCRITFNRYGGRTKVSFYGPDHRRSVLCFRIDLPRPEQFTIPVIDLLQRLSDGTFNNVPKVINRRQVTVTETVHVKEVITDEATDLELLERVNQNIKTRLTGRPKKKTPPAITTKILTMEAAG